MVVRENRGNSIGRVKQGLANRFHSLSSKETKIGFLAASWLTIINVQSVFIGYELQPVFLCCTLGFVWLIRVERFLVGLEET